MESGTTVQQLFGQTVKSGNPENYLIRVNRLPVPQDQVLQEGDRVSVTPTKIEGAELVLGLTQPLAVGGV